MKETLKTIFKLFTCQRILVILLVIHIIVLIGLVNTQDNMVYHIARMAKNEENLTKKIERLEIELVKIDWALTDVTEKRNFENRKPLMLLDRENKIMKQYKLDHPNY